MSLAEELLADFDDAVPAENDDLKPSVKDEAMDTTPSEENGQEVDSLSNLKMLKGVRVDHYAKLFGSEKLTSIREKLDHFDSLPKRDKIVGPIEADPEYTLIVDANNLVVDIDNEISIIHKYVMDIYSQRFPELSSLIPNSMEYLKTVHVLKNSILENSKLTSQLSQFLVPATLMILSVTASTSKGTFLSDEEIERCIEACDMAVELQSVKLHITVFVESRMSLIAPNVSIIVGSSCAAKVIGHAGGITALSKMPSCNILILGSQKKNLGGFSTNQALPHTGYIYNSDLVQKLPPDLRLKASRLVANKLTLASRVDAFHELQDGTAGESFRLEIDRKLEKWLEPPPVKNVKALPIPVDPPAKKRGGRRYRKLKERMGMSDMRRTANRIQFGNVADDAYQEDLGYNAGSLGKAGISGKIRAPQVDSKTKARVSKSVQQKLNRYGGLSTMPTTALGATTWGAKSSIKSVAGTASSVSFTPLQGLEIVNPNAVDNQADSESKKYFSATAGFSKIKTPLPPPS